MRIVLDANVVIAAFAARGLCEFVLELCLSEAETGLSEAKAMTAGNGNEFPTPKGKSVSWKHSNTNDGCFSRLALGAVLGQA